MYNSCQQAKTTKIYKQKPKEQSQHLYQFIYSDLIEPITLKRFLWKCYFFIFTNDYTYHIKTYIGIKMSNWLQYLKSFHNLAKIRTKSLRLTKKIQSDYSSELQSKKIDQWLALEEIILEP